MTIRPRICLSILFAAAVGILFFPQTLSAAESRYVNRNDGTVEDPLTELIWIKDPEQILSTAGPMIWLKANKCCRELVYADSGPGTWSLPNIKELQTLVEESNRSPRIDTAFFNAIPSSYWSSTDDTGGGMRVWAIQFSNGDLQSLQKMSLLTPVYARVRCVRRAAAQ
jgi:hypothetical protein